MARTQINFIKEPKNNHFCTIKWKSQGSCTLDVVSCRILNRAQWYLCRPVAFTNRLASTKSEWGFFSLIVQAISDTKRTLISFVCFLIWQRTMDVFGGLVLRSRIRFLHNFIALALKQQRKKKCWEELLKVPSDCLDFCELISCALLNWSYFYGKTFPSLGIKLAWGSNLSWLWSRTLDRLDILPPPFKGLFSKQTFNVFFN